MLTDHSGWPNCEAALKGYNQTKLRKGRRHAETKAAAQNFVDRVNECSVADGYGNILSMDMFGY